MSMSKGQKLSSDTIVSVSAIVIALASIIVTTWQGIETRKHNRLSVRPKLEIVFESGKGHFGYVVKNNGLGPAIITGKKIFVDGEEINYRGFSGLSDFIEKLNLDNRDLSHGAIFPGKSFMNGEVQYIVNFEMTEKDDPEKLLPEIYKRVGFEITYESMYGEPFVCKIPLGDSAD